MPSPKFRIPIGWRRKKCVEHCFGRQKFGSKIFWAKKSLGEKNWAKIFVGRIHTYSLICSYKGPVFGLIPGSLPSNYFYILSLIKSIFAVYLHILVNWSLIMLIFGHGSHLGFSWYSHTSVWLCSFYIYAYMHPYFNHNNSGLYWIVKPSAAQSCFF